MKLSLFDMVDSILSAMDSDEVNSIDDTVEAQQVARIIKDCYFAMMANRNWQMTKRAINLQHINDLTKPVYLKAPEGMKEMLYFAYQTTKPNYQEVYREVSFREPDEFLRIVNRRGSLHSRENIEEVVDFGGVKLYVLNNQDPTYWSTFDDKHIVCDSYNKAAASTLVASRSQALGFMTPTWRTMDDFIPELPIEAFPALLAEAKSVAFFELKQMGNEKQEQVSQKQQRWLARKQWTLEGGIHYPNYGRRGRK